MTRCPKCKVPVRFERTVNNKLMPLNPEPVLDGNVVIRGGVVHALKQDEQPQEGELRYVSHFSTCTAPKEFRARKSRSWNGMIEQNERSRRADKARA